MVEAGIDVARLNFSHGNREMHAENAELVRTRRLGRRPPGGDPPGPARARRSAIGALEDDIAELKPGEKLVLAVRRELGVGNGERMSVSLGRPRRAPSTPRTSSTSPTARSACASQTVREGDGEVETAVEIGGTVASRQGLNIPGSTRGLPAVPEEDLDMLRFGESIGVDLVALSFVRTAEDVPSVRRTPACR